MNYSSWPSTFIIISVEEIGVSAYSLYTVIQTKNTTSQQIASSLRSMSKLIKLKLKPLIDSNTERSYDALVYSSITHLDLLTPSGSTVSTAVS